MKFLVPADSRVVAPAAASPIRTQYPESRICRKSLRGSFDALCSFKFRQRRGLCPSAKDASEGFRVCLSGVLQNTVPAGRVCDHIYLRSFKKVRRET